MDFKSLGRWHGAGGEPVTLLDTTAFTLEAEHSPLRTDGFLEGFQESIKLDIEMLSLVEEPFDTQLEFTEHLLDMVTTETSTELGEDELVHDRLDQSSDLERTGEVSQS